MITVHYTHKQEAWIQLIVFSLYKYNYIFVCIYLCIHINIYLGNNNNQIKIGNQLENWEIYERCSRESSWEELEGGKEKEKSNIILFQLKILKYIKQIINTKIWSTEMKE